MRRLVLAVLALLVAAAIGGAWYAYEKGFTKKWRSFVRDEFRERGVEVTLRRLMLVPFRGIVARDVKVYDTRDRERVLAVIDEMRLVINYANLVQGKPFLDALELRDASLALPVDAAKPRGAKIEITKLSGRLLLPPQQLYLSRLEAELWGIRVTATGRLINPEAIKPAKPDGIGMLAAIERLADELRELKFENGPPQLDVRFSGDLARPEALFVEATLWGEKIRRKNYQLENLYAAVTYREGAVEVRQLVASDARGALRVSGTFQTGTREAALRLESGLDLQALARATGTAPQLDEFVFYEPPALELTLEASFGEPARVRLIGHASLQRFAYKSVMFEGAAADLSWDGVRWSARDVRLAHRTGEITGDVMQLPGDFRTRLKSTINPKALAPLLSGKAAEIFSQFDFIDPPEIEAKARGTAPTLDACSGSAELKFGRASYRGIAAESLTASARYEQRKLTLDPFRVERTEGGGGGALSFDFNRNEVRLEKVRASVHPAEVITWVDRDMIRHVTPYRFPRQPPTVTVDGIVHTKRGKTTRLSIDVDAPTGMDYTFLKREMTFPRLSGNLLFTPGNLRISGLSATLFGGRLSGEADISLERTRPGHRVKMQLESVDFASLTKLYFGFDDAKGQLSGVYSFTGRGDDARTMQGRGEASLRDGRVFAIPFLGPLSGILNSIVPGMGHDVARSASASFAISEGVISTSDLLVEGNGFSMLGGGKLWFLDDRMDFSMRINAQGIPGVLLFPVSKLFEYVADEKLSKPVWRPKALPRFGDS